VVASNQPAAQPPQPTNNPTTKPPDLSRPTPNISPEKDAINRALGLYKDAYQSESLEELLKIWPSLSKDQRKELKKGFEKAQAVRVDLENCTDPDVAGDRAQVTCAQSMRYTVNGKVQPYQKMSVNIVFRKTAGGWLVDAVQAN
jgi:hypothetical protein